MTDSEAWLVLRAQSGDRTALETLLDGVQRPLHRYVLRLISSVSSSSCRRAAVLILHYQHDLTIDEVAAVLGIAPGTVKSRLAYGLRRLRETEKGRPHDTDR